MISDGRRSPEDRSQTGICSHLLASDTIESMATRTTPLPVRIPADIINRIDRLRGLIPREAYVRDLLNRALKAEERKAK